MDKGWAATIGAVVAVAGLAIAAADYFPSVREKDDLRVEVDRTAHLPYLSEDGAFVVPTARRLTFTNRGNRPATVLDILLTIGPVGEFSNACGGAPTIAGRYRVPATVIRAGEISVIELADLADDPRAKKGEVGYVYLAAIFPELKKGQRIGGCLWFRGSTTDQKIASNVPLFDFMLGDGKVAAQAAKADMQKSLSISAVLIQHASPW